MPAVRRRGSCKLFRPTHRSVLNSAEYDGDYGDCWPGSGLPRAEISAYTSQIADSARILGLFIAPSTSRRVIHRAPTMELARRGHQLVVVTPHPINDPTFPNYTEIISAYTSQIADSARILGLFIAPSTSRRVIHRAPTMELARRGHQLVVVTPHPINDPTFPNYTEIDISFLCKSKEDMIKLAVKMQKKNSVFDSIKMFFVLSNKMSEKVLGP
ncbi:hypothetical protein PR048_016773 [Dryococelus australis]|uniref:Uncharacterized protein n=1 Tax=Dryococelus australis TaxID=614101 RepID=A0ABQ9H7M6_9NEOP|nr:hypothetical protein PR048_016773 [Dryococelus australis]